MLKLVCLLSSWITVLVSTSLPHLYFKLGRARGVEVRDFRRLEKAGRNLSKVILDHHYFEKCEELGVCPQFLKFKPPNLRAYKDVKQFYQRAVKKQLGVIGREIKRNKAIYLQCWEKIRNQLGFFERLTLISKLNGYYKSEAEKVLNTHKEKLTKLWNDERCRSPPCLINLSKRKLNVCEENALRLGLKHHILPKEIRGDDLKVGLESLVDGITKDIAVKKKAETGQWQEPTLPSDLKDELKFCVNSFTSQGKIICSTKQNQALHKTLKKLASDKTIKVCRFDKGNGTVILDSEDYFEKLDKIILDKSKFQEVKVSGVNHPIIRNETSIQNFLREHVKPVDSVLYSHLYPTGSQPGKVYGMCKVHKDGYPLRPVISMINTAEYNLAKWLDNYIKPNIPCQYSVVSTNEFLDNLKHTVFDKTDKIVSFDVVSLYTNIPLMETIDLIVESLYSEKSVKVPPVDKTVFRELLRIATGGMFLYKDTLYKQVDGVAMGSPLGPSLANFFLGHIEEQKLFKNDTFYPIVYLRYVDDIFAVFENGTTFHPFFNLLNSQHANLKFTVEEAEGSFPFLDVNIEINGNSVDTWVFRKKTHTGVMLNFSAVVPSFWKTGLIHCLLNRAKVICSSQEFFNREVEKLRRLFMANGYPKSFFDKTLDRFLAGRVKVTEEVSDQDEVPEKRYTFGVPYLGNASRHYKKKVASLIKEHLGVDISPYDTSCKVSEFFSLKSITPFALKARLVYKFTCLRDSDTYYIGKTKRHLVTRVKEHVTPKVSPKSEIKNHIFECNSCKNAQLSTSNFRILKQCKNDYSARISEALLLKKFHPKLNTQKYTKGESYLLKVF